MIYYILESDNNFYLKQIVENKIEVTENLNLAYKFSCEKSALVFKEANKFDDFKVCRCSYF